jgi:hypothetical protein
MYQVFFVAVAVAATGCVGGSGPGGGSSGETGSASSGVVVDSFQASQTSVPSDQRVQLRLRLLNQGESGASNVYARVSGPPLGDSGRTVWKPVSGESMSPEYRTMEFGTLREGREGTPPVPKVRDIGLQSPGLREGRDISYTFNSKVYYYYSNSGTFDLTVMGESRYEDAQGSGSRVENSQGPVKLSVSTDTPVPVYDSGEVTKKICLVAENVGRGEVFAPSSRPESASFDPGDIRDAKDQIVLRIDDLGGVEFSPVDSSGDSQTISMQQGRGIGCFQMELSNIGPATERTLPVKMTALYGYTGSGSTQVSVRGTGTDPGLDTEDPVDDSTQGEGGELSEGPNGGQTGETSEDSTQEDETLDDPDGYQGDREASTGGRDFSNSEDDGTESEEYESPDDPDGYQGDREASTGGRDFSNSEDESLVIDGVEGYRSLDASRYGVQVVFSDTVETDDILDEFTVRSSGSDIDIKAYGWADATSKIPIRLNLILDESDDDFEYKAEATLEVSDTIEAKYSDETLSQGSFDFKIPRRLN